MPVQLLSTPGMPRPAGKQAALLLPNLAQLLEPGADERALREQAAEHREARLRRRELEYRAIVAETTGPYSRTAQLERAAQDSQASRSNGGTRTPHGQPPVRPTPAPGAAPPAPTSPSATAPEAAPTTAALEESAPPPSATGPYAARVIAPTPGSDAHAAPHATEAHPVTDSPATSAAVSTGLNIALAHTASAASSSQAVQAPSPSSAAQSLQPTDATKATGTAPHKSNAESAVPRDTKAGQVTDGAQRTESDGEIDANIQRILRLFHTRLGTERSVATLRLDPPELGMIRLHMDLRHDRLALGVETQTAAAQRLLSKQLDALRENLEASGVQLERVEIRTMSAAAHDTSLPHTSQHAGAWTETPPQWADQRAASAGGGWPREPESPPGESPECTAYSGNLSPAQDVRVNVWA